MKNKLIIGFLTLLLSPIFSFSQNEVDALRYSYLKPSGTARYNSMGGAFGALGADGSMLSFNPAGIGVYKVSDFSFSPGFILTNTNSTFMNKISSDYDFNFNFNNISYIGVIPLKNEQSSIKSINVGISYNKINDFNSNIIIGGKNTYNSMTNWFASKANGIYYSQLNAEDNFYSNLAWEAYLINQNLPDTTSYVSALGNMNEITQEQLISSKGRQGEYNFSSGINFENKLFIGASIGIQSIRYVESKIFTEKDPDDLISDFKSFTFTEYLKTTGSGVNFKLGFLFSPVDWIRFGGAVHTPTFMSLNDNFYTSVESSFETDYKSQQLDSQYGINDYQLVTPFRANASIGFIISKVALIDVDYEFVDYSLPRLRSDNYGFFDENENVRTEYNMAHNLKIGMEYRFGPFSFRLGGAYYDSPYNSGHINSNSYMLSYNGGIGIRSNNVYFDLAYSLLTGKYAYFMYEGYGVNAPATDIKLLKNSLIATIGFKF